jgi:hypothetical protein
MNYTAMTHFTQGDRLEVIETVGLLEKTKMAEKLIDV